MKTNLFTKFLSFSYGSWIGLIIGLLITMLTTRILPPESYGKISMIDLFVSITLTFTVFGTDQSFIRFYYEEKPENRGGLLYNSIKFPLISNLIIILIILLLHEKILILLIGSSDFIIAIFISVSVLLQLLLRFGKLVIRMQQKGNLYSVLEILQKVFNLIFIIIIYHIIGSNFKVLLYSNVFAMFLVTIISIYFGKNFWGLNNIRIKSTKHSQTEILRYGSPFILTLFISNLLQSLDKIAIRYWSSFEELGLYTAAMKLVSLLLVLKVSFSTFWTPVSYERFEKNPNDKTFFSSMTILISVIMFFVGILCIVSKDIIVLLFGDKYRDAAQLMPFLVFMPIFYTISETTMVGINFYKKTYWHILISLISCVINFLGNWILVPKFGAVGASISTAFSFIVFFSLRTHISEMYFKVAYPLAKIYFMILVLSLYAFCSLFITSLWLNIIVGLISLVTLIMLFVNDIKEILQKRKLVYN